MQKKMIVFQSNWVKTAVFLCVFFGILQLVRFCDATETSPSSAAGRGTNITVDSSDREPFSLNKKTETDEKPVFYKDENITMGFNEDAEPNISSRF